MVTSKYSDSNFNKFVSLFSIFQVIYLFLLIIIIIIVNELWVEKKNQKINKNFFTLFYIKKLSNENI